MNIPLPTAFTIKASSVETASTTGLAIALGSAGNGLPSMRTGFVLVTVAVTAITGTLLLALDVSGNSGNSWSELATIGVDGERTWGLGSLPTAFTAVSSVNLLVSLVPTIRYRSIIGGGTPSVTYSVTGQYLVNPDFA